MSSRDVYGFIIAQKLKNSK